MKAVSKATEKARPTHDSGVSYNDKLSERIRHVGLIMAGATCIGLAGLGARVYQVTRQPDPRLNEIAESHYRVDVQPARRGRMLDRYGRLLAGSLVCWRVFVDPSMIENMGMFAQHVAVALDMDPADVDRKLGMSRSKRYVVLKEELNDIEAARVRALDMAGVGLEKMIAREYPNGSTAGQLTGFVGKEHKGLGGLEYLYEEELSGTPGRMGFVVDSGRRSLVVQPDLHKTPREGENVSLTIDLVIQKIAEKALAESCEHYEAKRGNAMVIDARTGEVLAMASWPPYNPEQGGNVAPEERRNHAVTDAFEPGSIFKPVVYALALEEGVTTPDEMIDTTTSGRYVFRVGRGRRALRDSSPVGLVPAVRVLIKSSNIGMAIFGLRMGSEKLYNGLKAFGFGERTEIGLSGESNGVVNPLNRWNPLYSLTSVPMGQEIAVTPLQMARAFSVFANDGKLLDTHIVYDRERPITGKQVVSKEVAAHLRDAMRRVVTEGTGKRARSKKYRLWGKTGTAQVPRTDGVGYIPDAYTGSFVAGAPLDQPRLIVSVHIYQPVRSKGYYGGVVAAPYVRKIMEQSLEYLGVPHDAYLDQENPRP